MSLSLQKPSQPKFTANSENNSEYFLPFLQNPHEHCTNRIFRAKEQ